MKKTLTLTALSLLVLTGCSANENTPAEPDTPQTNASSTSATPQPTSTSPTPSPTASTESGTEAATPATSQELTAHVADNGDVTWTDKDGNPVTGVSWETVNNYPFTQEELAKIQGGLEAEFADPAATGAPGELVDHSDAPVQSDEEIANRLNADYEEYADQMYQQNMDSAQTDAEYAQAYCTGDTSSPDFDAEYCAANGF